MTEKALLHNLNLNLYHKFIGAQRNCIILLRKPEALSLTPTWPFISPFLLPRHPNQSFCPSHLNLSLSSLSLSLHSLCLTLTLSFSFYIPSLLPLFPAFSLRQKGNDRLLLIIVNLSNWGWNLRTSFDISFFFLIYRISSEILSCSWDPLLSAP